MDNKAVPPGPLPTVLRVLLLLVWFLISGFMAVVALVGLVCTLLGLLSFVVDLTGFLDLQLGGKSVETTTQKLLFTAVGAVMAITGIGFWWLRLRRSVVGALVCYAVLVALFLAVGWAAGTADVISVGGPAR